MNIFAETSDVTKKLLDGVMEQVTITDEEAFVNDKVTKVIRTRVTAEICSKKISYDKVYVCGGGRKNSFLIERIKKIVKLSANESALGVSPKVKKEINNKINFSKYPDNKSENLRLAISKNFKCKFDKIICGAGSDEIIQIICQLFLKPRDEVIVPQYSFLMYRIYAKITGANVIYSKEKNFKISISHTTRKPRSYEINGNHYFFVSDTEFQKLITNEKFLEYAKVFNNYYGSSKDIVIEKLNKGENIIFDIDWQGTQQLKKIENLSIVTFFILPPNIKVLKNRLLNRHQGQEELIKKRMNKFHEEISHWNEYSYVVVNDDLELCHNEILNIINFEKKGISKK